MTHDPPQLALHDWQGTMRHWKFKPEDLYLNRHGQLSLRQRTRLGEDKPVVTLKAVRASDFVSKGKGIRRSLVLERDPYRLAVGFGWHPLPHPSLAFDLYVCCTGTQGHVELLSLEPHDSPLPPSPWSTAGPPLEAAYAYEYRGEPLAASYAYESALTLPDAPLEAYLNLAVLYWEGSEMGNEDYPETLDYYWDHSQMVLDRAEAVFGPLPAITFWRRYMHYKLGSDSMTYAEALALYEAAPDPPDALVLAHHAAPDLRPATAAAPFAQQPTARAPYLVHMLTA